MVFNEWLEQGKVQLFIKWQWFIESLLQKIVFFWTRGHSHQRVNHLSQKDIIKIYYSVRKGDIILAGNLRDPVSLAYPGPLTHAALYLGRRKIIHATAEGVHYSTLHHFVTTYDTVVILRLPHEKRNERKQIIKKAIIFAKKQVGKEYESFFKHRSNQFFCTELVNTAFHHAGHKTGLRNLKPFYTFFQKLEKSFLEVENWLRPEEFMRGRFKVVFMSHNLKMKGKKIILMEKG